METIGNFILGLAALFVLISCAAIALWAASFVPLWLWVVMAIYFAMS